MARISSLTGWRHELVDAERVAMAQRSTARCERPAAEAAVAELYAAAGLASPRVVWVESPLAGAVWWERQRMLCWVSRRRRCRSASVRAAMRAAWRSTIVGLQDELDARFTASCMLAVENELFKGSISVGAMRQLEADLRARFPSSLRRMEGALWNWAAHRFRPGAFVYTMPEQLSGLRRDQQQANRLNGDRYWRAVDHAQVSSRVACTAHVLCRLADLSPPRMVEAARSATGQVGGLWLHGRSVVVSERPWEIHRDADGCLHRDNGPAVRWADGWGIHLLHGTVVPADPISPRLGARRALKEPAVETRRLAVERAGWATTVLDALFDRAEHLVADPDYSDER